MDTHGIGVLALGAILGTKDIFLGYYPVCN